MITEIEVENYKSLNHFKMEVGRFNVLIGENGCGKSNILEAITLAGAAEANKLDKEFLLNRGIRVTEPELMRSAFDSKQQDVIKIRLVAGCVQTYTLKHDNERYSLWKCDEKIEEQKEHKTNLKFIEQLKFSGIKLSECEIGEEVICDFNEDNLPKDYDEEAIHNAFLTFYEVKKIIKNFIIFSPENTTLRDFSKETKIEPLGDKGEGLLNLLIYTQDDAKQSKDFSELNDIKETLELFGWYEAIEIPEDFSPLARKIIIKDRYLGMPFDQRSANEGFLFVLFYVTLMVSKYTPKIFAIDNIDISLNPKLCTKLITELTRLAKKYNKQVFVTTHNPAILDGIDLGDDEQRLIAVSRNRQGHTRCKRITVEDKPKSSVRDMLSRLFKNNETYAKKDILNKFDNNGDPLDISYAFSKAFDDKEIYNKEDILNKFDNSEEPVKLAYAFLRGYLGGLPKNF